MITLAVHTGISAREWGREGARAIATGLEVLAEKYRAMYGAPSDEEDDDTPANGTGPQYSG